MRSACHIWVEPVGRAQKIGTRRSFNRHRQLRVTLRREQSSPFVSNFVSQSSHPCICHERAQTICCLQSSNSSSCHVIVIKLGAMPRKNVASLQRAMDIETVYFHFEGCKSKCCWQFASLDTTYAHSTLVTRRSLMAAKKKAAKKKTTAKKKKKI
jgi:hypothetical protein